MINENFARLENNYLFAEIAARVKRFKEQNPSSGVISLGIGDVTLPLAEAVVAAMREAAAEQGRAESFRGYGPYEGYDFLREAIAVRYERRSTKIAADEVFVSDGAKNDLAAILSLFKAGSRVVIPDPVYPAYLDANVLFGNEVLFVDGTERNGFLPSPPDCAADIAYLCSPNNPTGAVYTREGLKSWVDWANDCGAVIIFDAAYEGFVSDSELPRSIFETEGARECAIEISSFSKSAGFTGTRCGFTVVPRELERDGKSLRALWAKRAAIMYNGCSYVIQRGAAAALSGEGERQSAEAVEYYRANARVIAASLAALGIESTGGVNSPYVWFKCPGGLKSWEVFDILLERAQVVCTPGAGFGKNGEGRCRFSAFGSKENTAAALERVSGVFASL